MIPDDFQSFRFSFAEVAPTLSEVFAYLHLDDPDTLDEDHPVVIALNEINDRLADYKGITGGYVVREVAGMNLNTGVNAKLNTGPQVAGYLKGASHIAAFICTAGALFTELSATYTAQGDLLAAYIADTIGSLTVEQAMDHIQEHLTTSLTDDQLQISNRYSPGYCNWALAEQRQLFHLIGANPVGISLSDSCLMSPIKSVSGIIGIGPKMKRREYKCDICQNSTCIYRNLTRK